MAVSFLNRARTIAAPGYGRWLIPPAALCVHLCIGQAYAFSVFNLPMTRLIGITQATQEDWKLTELGWIFSLAIFSLGASAAVFGRWVEEGGPRQQSAGIGPILFLTVALARQAVKHKSGIPVSIRLVTKCRHRPYDSGCWQREGNGRERRKSRNRRPEPHSA